MEKKKIQTLDDIARMAGVCKSTVSRALSNSPLVNEQTRERICAIAREHNFQIHMPARRLSTKRSNTIAFVTHAHCSLFSVADLFTLEIMSGLTAELHRNGYDLLLVAVDPQDTSWVSQHIDSGRADGFILMTSTCKQDHIKRLAEMGAPFIAWGVPDPKYNYCTVTGDNFRGGLLAAQHLITCGRKRIAFLGGPRGELEVQLRHKGYAEALQTAGITPNHALAEYGEFSAAAGAEGMRTLLNRAPDLDAVFVNSDIMAITALKVLQQSGKRVPEDVAVVSYDNLSIAEQCTPSLTTVSQNVYLAGRLLGQNLLQYLQTGVVTHVTVPVELIKRRSA
jgi:DNA-binding LacI/PurR family transcriptional regulator